MAGSARWAVVGLACLLVLLDVEAILLEVDYPQTGNYSYVTLTCKRSFLDDLNSNQKPATFWRGTSRITSGSQLVEVTASTDVSISFVFNQDQEGSFSCRTALHEVSNVEKLAASPPATYNTPMMPHFILFPSLESMRKVNLSCAIQPGALTENYCVVWSRVQPTFFPYSDGTFNITVTETTEISSIPSEYRCIVSIDHSSTIQDEDYEPPIVVVHKRVLSTLSGEIGDVSVATGEPATFVCNALKQDTSFSISWKVDGETFTCGGTDASSENIQCYMNNETSSVLQIENTTALGVRSHIVECILQNVVPEEFRGDCVPRGSCDVTKSATLKISSGPTPTSTKTDCGDPPELVNGVIRSRNATLVIYHCEDQHYSPTGASDVSRTCLPNGNWSNERFYCIANSSWMSSTKFHGGAKYDVVIITTTVATVLASIIMVLIFGVYCWQRRKMKAKKHEPPMNAETLPAVADDTSEHSFPRHHASTTSGDTGSSQLQRQPYPLTLTEHLQQELSCKHMLFQKHHLELSKVVGQGESGLVYRGYINSSGGRELVAVKTGKALASPTDKEKLLKEVCVMLSFSHKNVMSLIGLCFDGEVPLLIMPFMINGTVLNYIKQNRENLYFGQSADKKQVESARNTSLGVCHQIANGMSYLTKHKFVHRDLAARNCMIDGDGLIKVADFGLTEDMYATNYYRRGGGEGGEGGTGREEKVPIRWMAPESIEADFYDEKTDVWSFGVTCWEVMTCGGVPYAGIHIRSLLRELNSGHRLDRPSNAVCSDEIWEMMTSCWSTSPGNRPTFTLLVKEFFQMLDNDTSYLKLNDSFKKSQLNTLV